MGVPTHYYMVYCPTVKPDKGKLTHTDKAYALLNQILKVSYGILYVFINTAICVKHCLLGIFRKSCGQNPQAIIYRVGFKPTRPPSLSGVSKLFLFIIFHLGLTVTYGIVKF